MANGLFGVPNVRDAMIQRAFAPDTRPQPAPTKKPGLFGQGGIGRAIAGTIGDVLLQRGGNAPIYGPAQQYRQALAEQQRMASLERQNDMQDWIAKQQWERDNPKPPTTQPYRWEDNAGNVWERDPNTGENNRIFTDVVPKYYVQGDRAIQIGNPFAGSTSGPAPGAVEDGYRFKGGNPADPNAWEEVLSDEQGGASLSAAYQTNSITRDEADRVRMSLGPNGQAAFQKWMRDNNITIGGR